MSLLFSENKSCGVKDWDLIDKGFVWSESQSTSISVEDCQKFCQDEKLKLQEQNSLCYQHTVIAVNDPASETKVCHISTDKLEDLNQFEGKNGLMKS